MYKNNITKFCTICRTEKPIEQFYKAPSGLHSKRGECKDCTRLRHKLQYDAQKKEDPNVIRDIHLLKTYGITSKEIELLVSKYKGCMICQSKTSNAKDKNWHVDHDKKENTIRGILCVYCNIGLGAFRESPELLIKAVNYLQKDKLSIPVKPKKIPKRSRKLTNYDLREIIKQKGTEWFEAELKNIREYKKDA